MYPMNPNLGFGPKDFVIVIQVCQVVAHFKALDELICLAPSILPCIFLHPKNDLRNNVTSDIRQLVILNLAMFSLLA